MRFARLAATSQRLAATRSRREKVALIADLLRPLRGGELSLAARYLAGQVRQERLDVGWAMVAELQATPAAEETLELVDVDAALEELTRAGGSGSRASRRAVLEDLFGRATAGEQTVLRGLVLGELRQGALEGVVVQGLAAAADVPVADVQRALMLTGDLGETTVRAVEGGQDALAAVSLEVFRPVQPMLAATSGTVADALAALGGSMAVDAKLDGARIQVHRRGNEVRVYTRNLREVARPDVVDIVRALPADDLVLDGEVMAIGGDGRPQRFQETMSTFGTEAPSTAQVAPGTVLTPFFFDCLLRNGVDLLDEPLSVRHEALSDLVPERFRVPRTVVDDLDRARVFFASTLEAGHEGVVCKDLDAPYAAGRRGSAWRKVKPVHTLDLVVLAAEWGSGRRRGWLSNLHLGARDPDDTFGHGGFVMLGKTFKGLTDEMLTWQTDALEQLAVRRNDHVVHVRPELVVEIAFDGVQRSSRYPGGVALRFARVKGYRVDKDASQADTIETVKAIYAGKVPPVA